MTDGSASARDAAWDPEGPTLPPTELDEVVADTTVTLETPRNFCPDVGLVGSRESQWDAGTAGLLHRRLRALGLLYCVVSGVAQTRELFIDVGFTPVPALIVLFTMALGTAYLYWQETPPLAKLRMFEVYFFAAPAAGLVFIDYQLMVLSVTPGIMLMNWYRFLVHMALLIAGYTLFIPANWRRTLVVTSLMGALPFVCLAIWMQRVPVIAAAMQIALTTEIYTGGLMLAVIMVAIAVYGTYTIDAIRHQVADAGFAGQYHLEKKLGKGGMGEVWLARHRMLTRPTAIKMIRADVVRAKASQSGGSVATTDPEHVRTAMKRFEREAQATASLTSPHTIDVYDFGVAGDGTFYYAMEFLDGLDLETLVEKHGPVPVERAVHLLAQACDSLADAHDNGLIHRDVKPGNIFATRMGIQHDFVKVLDFGLVKETAVREPATALTQEGMTSGTPAFMAPEIALGKSNADGRADIYALACVGYWLTTGHYVFEADTPMAMVVDHVRSEPAAPSTRTELPIPREFDDVILRALAKDPAVRFQDMRELAAALRRVPVEQPWDQARAAEWWQLRGRAAEPTTVH